MISMRELFVVLWFDGFNSVIAHVLVYITSLESFPKTNGCGKTLADPQKPGSVSWNTMKSFKTKTM